jgi:hypothetical protein
MCGFVGSLGLPVPDETAISWVCSASTHRGPDGEGPSARAVRQAFSFLIRFFPGIQSATSRFRRSSHRNRQQVQLEVVLDSVPESLAQSRVDRSLEAHVRTRIRIPFNDHWPRRTYPDIPSDIPGVRDQSDHPLH